MILNEGFEISALEMFHFSKATIEEFYDVYKNVLPEYVPQIEQFISGPSIVLEVRQANVVKTFREMVGPSDPEIAKYLRPDTIRAKFGFDRVRNAVHCTDLPEDGVIECEYFFKILQNYQ
jgi:nucleoside-diphosphate kinase